MTKPIGQQIKEELERQERTVSWLARKIPCNRSNVYRLFGKNCIDTGLLTKISTILEHDFFSSLSSDVQEIILSRNERQK